MQHQVPQFINVEDKIFGPLTAKQFFYLLGGGALVFILYIFLQTWLAIILGIPVAAFSLALAFLKVNGMPFIKILNSALGFVSSNRLYLWKKRDIIKPRAEIKSIPPSSAALASPRLTQSKLQDLSWSLDVQRLKR